MPKFYLQRFADERRQLMRVPLSGGPAHRLSIDDATVQKDFYSFEDTSGQLNDSVEDALGEMEGEAAEVFRMVVDRQVWPLPQAERMKLAEWAAIQHVRGPAFRRASNQVFDALSKILFAAGGKPELRRYLEEVEGRPVTDDEVDEMWEEMTDFDKYSVEPVTGDHLTTMGTSVPAVMQIMAARSWALCRFERKALITSDHPVILKPYDDHPPFMGVGLANAESVVVPLDRRVALIMSEPGAADFEVPPSSRMARSLNQGTASNARAAIFHHPDDDPLTGIRLPEPRTDEVRLHNADPRKWKMPDGMGAKMGHKPPESA